MAESRESREWTGEGELPEGVTEPPMVSREYRRLQNAYADEQADKEIAEERCAMLQREIKELRDQLDMYATAARFGVLVVSQPTERATSSSSESTAAVSDPTAAVSDPTAAVSDPTAAVSDPTAAVSDSTAAVSDSTAAVSDSTAAVSDSTAAVSDPTAAVSDPTAAVSDPTAAVSDSTAAVSDPTAAVSDPTAAVSDSTAAVSDPTAAVSDPTAAVSDPTAAVSDSTAAVSDSTAAVSDSTAAVSDSTAAVSDSTAAVSDSTAAVSDSTAAVSDSTAAASEGTLTPEELIASLKLQLARVLESNRMKSNEILARLQEITAVKEDLTMTRNLIERLNKLCDDLQGAVNILNRHKDEVENLRKEMHDLFDENECYKEALQIVQAGKLKQEEVIANLIEHISTLHDKFELEKRYAVDICQKTVEEQLKDSTEKQKQELDAAKAEVDKMKILYSKLCVETSVKEAQLKGKTMALLENRLMVLLHMQRKEMARALEEHKDVPKEGAESELAGAYRRCEEMILDAKLTSFEKQSKVTQNMIDEIRRDVEEMWQTECGRPESIMAVEQ